MPYFRSFIITLTILCFSLFSKASHIFGGELNYTNVGGNTYEITLTLFGDCSGASFQSLFTAVPQIAIYNGFNAFNTITLNPYGIVGEEVTPVCPEQINNTTCKGGLLPGVARFIFKNTITLNALSNDWQFIFNGNLGGGSSAGRSSAITNIDQSAGFTIIKLVATLNNLQGGNNSSFYTTIPTPFFCINNAQQYNQGATDADGDALSFQLVPALNGNGNPLNYYAPYTYNNPLAASPGTFNFNTSNGQLGFTPNLVQNSVIVSKVIEKRNGVEVGSSMREMVFVVLNNCNNQSPIGGISNNNLGDINSPTEISICNADTNLQFKINPIDPDGGKVTVSYTGLPNGATVSILNNNTTFPSLFFSWQIPVGLAYGDYNFFITLQDDNCPLSSKQTIAYTIHYIQPISNTYVMSLETCIPSNDGSITIDANSIHGGFQYAINGSPFQNNKTFNGLQTGTYSITIKDASGCFLTTSAIITHQPLPTIDSISVNNLKCHGNTDGALAVAISPANVTYSFQLLPLNIVSSNPIFTNLLENNYTIIATDTNGCKDTATAIITEPAKLEFENLSIEPLTCNKVNGKIKIKTNFGGVKYKLLPTNYAIDTLGYFENLTAGTYTIIAENKNGCKTDTTIIVTEIPKTFSSYTQHKDLPCWGKGDEGEAEVILNGGVAPISILWSSSPPQTNALATGLAFGYYFVTAIDATGCELKDTAYVAAGNCCENVFLPNAFSPNGDGNNDLWKMTTSTGLTIDEFAIFNRWGQKIWWTRNVGESWDGKIAKSDGDIGTYYYILRYTCLSDKKHYKKTGDITLVR